MRKAARSGGSVGVVVLGMALTGCSTPSPQQQRETVSDYKDGVYTATGWYGSLPSHQDVTLTISDDIVTDVQITTPAADPTSLEHQQRFAAAIPSAVVGRDIDTLDIDRLAGASGCSEGFMNALAKITDATRTADSTP